MKKIICFLALVTAMTLWCSDTMGQSYFDDNESSLWNENDTLYEDSDFVGDDSDQYISVEEQYQIDAKKKAQQQKNKYKVYSTRDAGNLLKPNIIYGATTGLLVGGWFALNTQSSARDNFRFIGSGIILGSLMGLFIGSKPLRKKNVTISRLDQRFEFEKTNKTAFLRNPIKKQDNSFMLYSYRKQF